MNKLKTSNLRILEAVKKMKKSEQKRIKVEPVQLLRGNGNISILRENDTKYNFYLDLQEEIQECEDFD